MLATEPVVKAEASKVTVAVATVVIFGTLAIFLYPAMYPLVAHWFSPETYGIYIGSTMHEVPRWWRQDMLLTLKPKTRR